jgi:5-formyltetrahydrofolate cyclo-ligase
LDRVDGKVLTGFARTASAAELVTAGMRFAEPPRDAPLAVRGELDLIVVPALAVSSLGHRLGYGMGFYDATLPDFRPEALCAVVAFEFQLLAELPLEAHDVACDVVITDERTLTVGKA